jgi:hypothetical protein
MIGKYIACDWMAVTGRLSTSIRSQFNDTTGIYAETKWSPQRKGTRGGLPVTVAIVGTGPHHPAGHVGDDGQSH